MKLLYTLTTYPPSTGGAQIHQHQLACHLKERHNVQVISHWDDNRTDWLMGTTLNAPEEAKDYKIDDIAVHRMGVYRCEKIMMAPFATLYYPLMMVGMPPVNPIAHFIEKHLHFAAESADIIHNVRIGREGLSFASYRAARRFDIPFVLTPVHHPRWVGLKYNAFNKLYRLADALLALTEKEKDVLMQLGVEERKVHVIGHGPVLEKEAHPSDFLKQQGIDGPMVLFLGQHYAYKGYKEVLEAARIVWQKEKDVHFVFIGPPVENSEAVFETFKDNRIHRLGKVDLQTKTDALAACTMLCVPSTQESFGGVYAEAWCYQKPVIGCNIPAVSEVIDNETNGFLVDQQPQQIAERVFQLVANPTDAQKMGMAGKQKVEEKYTWNQIAQRVETIYKQLSM